MNRRSLQQLQPLLGRTLVIVAHPDDEAIACGGLLQQMKVPVLLYATDAAPQDEYFWGRFGSREAYAKIRQDEARRALACVGVHEGIFLADRCAEPLTDQWLFRSLQLAYAALRDVANEVKPQALLTLAYEGGHPDHDSCAVLTSRLAAELKIPAWEAPLYHRAEDGSGLYQQFVEYADEVVEYAVSGEEFAHKNEMLDCYKSQFTSLPSFDAALERFRPQAKYDFSRPPHGGKLNYEIWQWRMTGAEVSASFAAFLGESGV